MKANNEKTKIIFFGSTEFSVPIFIRLIENFNVLALATEPDKQQGRNRKLAPPPTKIIAEQHNVFCFQPKKIDETFIEKIKSLKPDLIVVAAYGKILPPEILDLPANKCINVHPSILPKYRGASPIQTALMENEKETGITIIIMDEGMDSGDILAQKKVEIDATDNFISLSKRLAEISAEYLAEIIPQYLNNEIELKKQDNESATFCRKIKKEDGKIDWNKSALEINNQIRAFAKWPGSYTFFSGKKLELMICRLAEFETKKEIAIGQAFEKDKNVFVKCGSGNLEILELKLEGKNQCNIKNFINGYRNFIGAILN
ncbi:methionyl-tRNA formyltransferase [Patescibacteria group bacterium]|nr:methionyl-tRNA formyltransferase [Patescibacteria group bacterium]